MKLYSIINLLYIFFYWCFFIPRILKLLFYIQKIIKKIKIEKRMDLDFLFDCNDVLKKEFGENGGVNKWQLFSFVLFMYFLKVFFLYLLSNYNLEYKFLNYKQCYLIYEFLSFNIIFFLLLTLYKITLFKLNFLYLESSASKNVKNFFILLEFFCLLLTIIFMTIFLIHLFFVFFLEKNFLEILAQCELPFIKNNLCN